MNDASPSFSQWLGAALNERRMGAGEIHERTRISRAAIYNYLNGKRVPDEDSLHKIADALSVQVGEIPGVERRRVGRPPTSASSVPTKTNSSTAS